MWFKEIWNNETSDLDISYDEGDAVDPLFCPANEQSASSSEEEESETLSTKSPKLQISIKTTTVNI